MASWNGAWLGRWNGNWFGPVSATVSAPAIHGQTTGTGQAVATCRKNVALAVRSSSPAVAVAITTAASTAATALAVSSSASTARATCRKTIAAQARVDVPATARAVSVHGVRAGVALRRDARGAATDRKRAIAAAYARGVGEAVAFAFAVTQSSFAARSASSASARAVCIRRVSAQVRLTGSTDVRVGAKKVGVVRAVLDAPTRLVTTCAARHSANPRAAHLSGTRATSFKRSRAFPAGTAVGRAGAILAKGRSVAAAGRHAGGLQARSLKGLRLSPLAASSSFLAASGAKAAIARAVGAGEARDAVQAAKQALARTLGASHGHLDALCAKLAGFLAWSSSPATIVVTTIPIKSYVVAVEVVVFTDGTAPFFAREIAVPCDQAEISAAVVDVFEVPAFDGDVLVVETWGEPLELAVYR